jgi:hypothetical protein
MEVADTDSRRDEKSTLPGVVELSARKCDTQEATRNGIRRRDSGTVQAQQRELLKSPLLKNQYIGGKCSSPELKKSLP